MNLAVISGYSFILLATLIILSNWYYAINAVILKESTSFTLFLGGVLGVIGIIFSEFPNFYFWLPLVVDFTFPLIIYKVFVNSNSK